METCDVLIVGGGPAGSSCSWGLRRSGLEVIVLDRENFPRDKVCGGWITPPVLAELEIDAEEYAQGRTLQPIRGFRVGCIGGPAIEIEYGKTVSYGIRRREFDDYLLRRSGARLQLGEPLDTLEHSGGRWIANARIAALAVVGAGGHFCPVARLTGARAGGETAVVAQEVEFALDAGQRASCAIQGEKPELYFCPDMQGYGWCFRKGNFLNIGLGRADPHQLTAHVAGFSRFLRESGRISFDVPAMRGHAYLLRGWSARPSIGEGVLLAGDAVGVAYPQSGEGIRPAIESGLLAAETLLRAGGRYETSRFEPYRRQMSDVKLPWVMRAAGLLPSACIPRIARTLLKTRWFTGRVVLDGWFLHSRSAQL